MCQTHLLGKFEGVAADDGSGADEDATGGKPFNAAAEAVLVVVERMMRLADSEDAERIAQPRVELERAGVGIVARRIEMLKVVAELEPMRACGADGFSRLPDFFVGRLEDGGARELRERQRRTSFRSVEVALRGKHLHAVGGQSLRTIERRLRPARATCRAEGAAEPYQGIDILRLCGHDRLEDRRRAPRLSHLHVEAADPDPGGGIRGIGSRNFLKPFKGLSVVAGFRQAFCFRPCLLRLGDRQRKTHRQNCEICREHVAGILPSTPDNLFSGGCV